MQNYGQHFSTRKTAQSDPIPGKQMVENQAGGHVFAVDDWMRLERFLVLGCEGNTYYATEQKMTKENASAVLRCIEGNPDRVVITIMGISQKGRAPKNDPALFALAMCASLADEDGRKAAFQALPHVARIGTHLFHFVEYCKAFRGWGRGMRNAVADWYNRMPADKLALQIIKYQQRDGWSHHDLLHLCHAQSADRQHNYCYRYAKMNELGEVTCEGQIHPDGDARPLLLAFDEAKAAKSVEEIIRLIKDAGLPRECIPTQWLNSVGVWEALLEKMPMTAMIRNLGKMSNVGLLAPLSNAAKLVCERLGDAERLAKARIHPIQVLAATITYEAGHGARGKLEWTPVPQVADALDAAFYKCFQNVEPTGKNILLGVDVSGSMAMGSIAGVPGLTPNIGAAAMALVTAATESNYFIHGFAGDFVELGITAKTKLSTAAEKAQLDFGPTDCAVPMLYALENKIDVDAFVVLTDSETWCGGIHPCQALQEYRQKMGRPAKLIVVGMVSNGFTIADPKDGGMLDVVGFNTATPQLMADFIRGA